MITEIRPREEIKSDSVQSPHDTEFAYRHKDIQSVKGYSANFTEACDKGRSNLIVDVQVLMANTSDVAFLQPAGNATEQVLEHKSDDLNANGAFQSPDNVKYCKEEEITPYFAEMQGTAGRYDLTLNSEKLTVIDTKTEEIIPARKAKSIKFKLSKERLFIRTTEGKIRYFAKKEIEAYQVQKQIAAMPLEKRNMRNNVEATIFQIAYHCNNSKTRYRGLLQNKMWAILRCIWLNIKKIVTYVEPVCQRTLNIRKIMTKKSVFMQNFLTFLL